MAQDHEVDHHTHLLDRVGRVPRTITEFLDLPLRIEPPVTVTSYWGFLIGNGKAGNGPRRRRMRQQKFSRGIKR